MSQLDLLVKLFSLVIYAALLQLTASLHLFLSATATFHTQNSINFNNQWIEEKNLGLGLQKSITLGCMSQYKRKELSLLLFHLDFKDA